MALIGKHFSFIVHTAKELDLFLWSVNLTNRNGRSSKSKRLPWAKITDPETDSIKTIFQDVQEKKI
ncbi:hypothetical protein T03_13613 [Trichinella britovi]|uniref:Uncharacterized protein n=1 Tax=Trichinella britovi TaxID=45882 RepID=A0A0V1D7K1_TRIBR|nr:hypothetical protein T03_13613 [Trichinella britovi]